MILKLNSSVVCCCWIIIIPYLTLTVYSACILLVLRSNHLLCLEVPSAPSCMRVANLRCLSSSNEHAQPPSTRAQCRHHSTNSTSHISAACFFPSFSASAVAVANHPTRRPRNDARRHGHALRRLLLRLAVRRPSVLRHARAEACFGA